MAFPFFVWRILKYDFFKLSVFEPAKWVRIDGFRITPIYHTGIFYAIHFRFIAQRNGTWQFGKILALFYFARGNAS